MSDMESENYYDCVGNPVTLEKLCRTEPGWAASRIRYMRKQLKAKPSAEVTDHAARWIEKYGHDYIDDPLRGMRQAWCSGYASAIAALQQGVEG